MLNQTALEALCVRGVHCFVSRVQPETFVVASDVILAAPAFI